MYSSTAPWYQLIDSSPVHPEIQCVWTSPPGRCKKHAFWLAIVKTTCSNVHSDWPNKPFTAFSYLPRQTCDKAFIFLTAHTVGHDWSLVFLTLGNVHQSYFVRLATGGNEKPYLIQWHWTIAFPRFRPTTHFSQLKPASFFPRCSLVTSIPCASHRFHVFSRLPPVTNFPAFSTGCKFSHVYGRSHVFPRFLFNMLLLWIVIG